MKTIPLLVYSIIVYACLATNQCIKCKGKYFVNCVESSPYVYPTGQKDSAGCVRSWAGGLRNQDLPLFSYEFLFYHESFCLCGYVPAETKNDKCKPIDSSSTTVGAGVDLGKMTTSTLISNYGVSQAFAQQLSPYCGLSGDKAIEYLQDYPLTLTYQQALNISEGAFIYKYNIAAGLIKKYCNYNFSDLTYAQRTAIVSMVYQGALTFKTTASDYICKKDWKSLVNYLRNPSISYKCRRRDESDIIAADLQNCTNPYSDISFIVDESSSISGPDYSLAKSFLQEFVSNTSIGLQETQFAIVRFSTLVECQVYFNTYNLNSQLINYINSMSQLQGSTNTASAINFTLSNVFKNTTGARNPSLGYGRIVIVITDGNSNNPSNTASAALEMRNAGITVYAIGVGAITYSELLNIAGTPNNVFTPDTYQDLVNILATVKKTACSTPGQSSVNIETKVNLVEKQYKFFMTNFDDNGIKVSMENGDKVQLYGSYFATAPYELQYDFKSSVGESLYMPFYDLLNDTKIAYFSAVSVSGEHTINLKVTNLKVCQDALDKDCFGFSSTIILKLWAILALLVV
ncbi:hypothetical protein SteCoe_37419 [Stentor coeruleus]|uniref:VWFA domain-containing protein n=1 Tax=Stentor coeruleus TaxID=5963 RepID=A0A1R2AN19_9CILI|nr:hypothetical protein SteCoe_37419 [Stentor coeruleus]